MFAYLIEPARQPDIASIGDLLRQVAAIDGGLVRTPAELSSDYLQQILNRSLQSGITLVARAKDESRILGVILAQALGPRTLAHVLGEVTMAVHLDHQNLGIGRALLNGLIDKVTHGYPHICRVELLTRESNVKARTLYAACGFREEGRLEGRIRNSDDSYEADIPMAWIRP